MRRDLHSNLNWIGPYLSHTLIRTRIKDKLRTLITSAQLHPWVRGSVATLFSQYTLVIISGLETTVIALKKAMVQRLLHFDRPFPAGHQIHRCTRGRLVDKIRTQPTRMYDEECDGRTGVGRTNQNNPR